MLSSDHHHHHHPLKHEQSTNSNHSECNCNLKEKTCYLHVETENLCGTFCSSIRASLMWFQIFRSTTSTSIQTNTTFSHFQTQFLTLPFQQQKTESITHLVETPHSDVWLFTACVCTEPNSMKCIISTVRNAPFSAFVCI